MTDEAAERALIVAEARKWLLTPYRPGAGLRGVGCDCGQLLVHVFADAGLVPPFETGAYPMDFHLHRGEERYLAFVEAHLAPTETPGPGDVMLFRIGRCYAHGGVLTALNPPTIVHAYLNAGRVTETRLRPDHELMRASRAPRFYTLWPPADARTALSP